MEGFVPGGLAYGGIMYLKHLWDSWKVHRFGIYGFWGVGKTTLQRQLSTTGELEVDPEEGHTATFHAYDQKSESFVLPKPNIKKVSFRAESRPTVIRRTISSTDLGGHPEYFDLWLEDMISRNVQIVIFLIDGRDINNPRGGSTQQSELFGKLVDVLITKNYPKFKSRKLRKKAKTYKPEVVALVANKADVWLERKWKKKLNTPEISEHPVFDPYRNDLIKLQRHLMVPTIKRCMSALHNWNTERVIYEILQTKP